MPKRQDLEDFTQKISLAQRISADDKHVIEYVGSSTELAESIAILNVMVEFEMIKEEDVKFMVRVLQEQNKANFWSSEKTDIFTKLGGFKPQKEKSRSFGKPRTRKTKVIVVD